MQITKQCARETCYNSFTTYTDKQCCSQRCAQLIKSDIKLTAWLGGNHQLAKSSDGSILAWARRYLMEQVQYACSICRWSEVSANGTIPLEIDHIDGNWQNSAADNLRVLCPNCHALTENWKCYNTGRNKKSRYQHYKDRGWH